MQSQAHHALSETLASLALRSIHSHKCVIVVYDGVFFCILSLLLSFLSCSVSLVVIIVSSTRTQRYARRISLMLADFVFIISTPPCCLGRRHSFNRQ